MSHFDMVRTSSRKARRYAACLAAVGIATVCGFIATQSQADAVAPADATGLAVLGRPMESRDAIPSTVSIADTVNTKSVRYVGPGEPGVDILVGMSADGKSACQIALIGSAPAQLAVAACVPVGVVKIHGIPLVVSSSLGASAAVIVPDRFGAAIGALSGDPRVHPASAANVVVFTVPDANKRRPSSPEDNSHGQLGVSLTLKSDDGRSTIDVKA